MKYLNLGRRHPRTFRQLPAALRGNYYITALSNMTDSYSVRALTNPALLIQRGCNKFALLIQRGCNKSALLIQRGCNKFAQLIQRGCNKSTLFIQRRDLRNLHCSCSIALSCFCAGFCYLIIKIALQKTEEIIVR